MKTDDRKIIAKWLQDETTIKNNINFINDNKNNVLNLRRALAMLNVSLKNYKRYEKEEKKKIVKDLAVRNYGNLIEEIKPNIRQQAAEAGIKKFPKGNEGVDFSFNEFFNINYNKDGTISTKKVNIDKVVEYLKGLFSFKTIFGNKGEEIYVYRKGIYVKKGRAIIQTNTEELLKEYSINYNIKEIQEKIKRLTEIDREQFDLIPMELVCLTNGILNLKTKELISHNPKYYFKTQLDLEYNPKAKCPKILKVLKEILYPEYLPVIQEWFGFNLYRKYFIKKAMILFGDTDTGKTQIINLLIKFIGEKNKSGISLQDIASGNRFNLKFLHNKYSNIRDDLSSNDLISGGEFKASTGGSYITAEHKFGDTFEFLTFAKHLFATNKIPKMNDNDDVFYSRCIPLYFGNPIPKDKQNPNILDDVTTKEEMSGLLNWALEGLDRLFKNNKFSFDKTDKEIKNIMERDSDPLSSFVQDCLIEKEGNKISKEAMFLIYTKYCQIKKIPRCSKEQLGRNLAGKTNYIIATGGKERNWVNVYITTLGVDAFDTFLKNLRDRKNSDLYMYKSLKKASKVNDFKQIIKPEEFVPKKVSSKLNVKIKLWDSNKK